MSENITQIIYVTANSGKTLYGYDIEKYERMKTALKKGGYREATQKEIEAKYGKLEQVKPEPKPKKEAKKIQEPEPEVINDVTATEAGKNIEVDEIIPEPTGINKDSETSKIE